MKNQGKKKADYQVLRNTKMPSILTECGLSIILPMLHY
ncbi:N-acetylmuramoyl-L-alanine amidase [Psychrobacillus antarcticus]|nr:N-acetylmuramoyl-L-alanine amidase [Psychrobacillus antarcticus]